MTSIRKAVQVLVSDPVYFRDTLSALRDVRLDRRRPGPPFVGEPRPWEGVQDCFQRELGVPLDGYLSEPAFAETAAEVDELTNRVARPGVFTEHINATPTVRSLCYALCRATQPSAVVETGVAYGAVTAHILAAMEVNGKGTLHSIDWSPRLEWSPLVGAAIPERLRSRWHLRRGVSRRLLRRTFREVGTVGMFVSDSSNTYRNILWEMRTAAEHLEPGAPVIVNMVESNAAFAEWTEAASTRCSAVVSAGPHRHACGVALVDGGTDKEA